VIDSVELGGRLQKRQRLSISGSIRCEASMNEAFVRMSDAFVRMNGLFDRGRVSCETSTNDAFVRTNGGHGMGC
jgi:hypothetical protein